ncbi:MAG: MarR family transcriptional regulator [Pirellulaceae bacterium]|nr:MarR family transcriptional regulator [Pirellulaceae bacterium]
MLVRPSAELNRRAAEMGEIVREIVTRFESANAAAASGPHTDLTLQETRVVELLGESGGQMMRAVAEYLGLAVNSVTSIADNLERKGLLRRVRSHADRRVVQVELTDAGHKASRSVMNVKAQFHRELLAALTVEEQAILLVLLRKVGGLPSKPAQPASTQSASTQSADGPDSGTARSGTARSANQSAQAAARESPELKLGADDSSGKRTDRAHGKPRRRKTK